MYESGSDLPAAPLSVVVLLGPCPIQPPRRTSDITGRGIQLFSTEDPTLIPPNALVVSDIEWVRGLPPERRKLLDTCTTDCCAWLMLRGDKPVTERLALLQGGVHELLEICNPGTDGVAATRKAVAEQARFAGEDLAPFRRLVDASSQAIGYADAQGHIRYLNPTHERLLGYTAAELQDQTFDTLFADEDKHYAAEIRAAIADGVSWQGQLPLRCADGSRLVSLSHIDAIRDKHGNIQYIFNVFSDFSAELERRRESKQALAEAEAANRAKSDFLSRMSHELRTPLNAILGFGQLIAADTALDAEHADSVSEVLKAGRHLLALIDEVLDLSKVESGDLSLVIEPIAVADAIAECLRLVQPLARRAAISLDWRVSTPGPAPAYLLGDRLRVRQVLLNLISNAIKYNRAEGSVRIWVETLTGDAGRLRIHVEDTGAGIPAERLAELFSPFNRLGAEYTAVEGTGIGLVITRRLCRMMGGDVDLRSTPGHGSDFWIELPLAPESPVTIAAAAHQVVPPRAAHAIVETAQQVLYIEDNPANLKLMEQIFSRRPQLLLTTATSGPGGLQRARETPPDLILLDINLPGMDGYAVLRELRRTPQTQSTPVIAVTANALPGDIEHGDAAGFTAYVTKPIDLTQFLDTLDRVLAESALPPS